MQIISGKYKGRKIKVPENIGVRPTRAQTREAIFNILQNNEEYKNYLTKEKVFLDICSGSGIVAIEALSRGVGEAILIDKSQQVKEYFYKNTGFIEEKTEYILSDIENIEKRRGKRANICFIDPPYEYQNIENIITRIEKNKWLEEEALIIIETDSTKKDQEVKKYKKILSKIYGKSRISFYKKTNV